MKRRQTADNWRGEGCQNYDDSQDVCLDDEVVEEEEEGDEVDAGHLMNLSPEGNARGRVKERKRVDNLKWLEDAVLQAAKDMYAAWKRRGGPEPSLTTSLLRDLAIEGTGGLPEDIKWMSKRQQDLMVLNALQKLKRKGLMDVSTGMGQRGAEAKVWNPVSASTEDLVSAARQVPWVYHVTQYRRLKDIAQKGLLPNGARSTTFGFNSHVKGKVFFTAGNGLNRWFELADGRRSSLFGTGMLIVVLRMRADHMSGVDRDYIGSGQIAESFSVTEKVPPGRLEVWDGKRWTSLPRMDEAEMIRHAWTQVETATDGRGGVEKFDPTQHTDVAKVIFKADTFKPPPVPKSGTWYNDERYDQFEEVEVGRKRSYRDVTATLLAVADYLDPKGEVSATSTYNAKARYKFLNDKLFDGALPDIPVTMRNLKRVGGHASAKILRNGSGGKELVPGSIKITLDSTYKRTQEQQDAILAHEMIHVYNYVHGLFTETHGPEFLEMAKKLETILGTTIPLTDETKNLEVADDTVKPVGVVMMLAGGNKKPEDGRWVMALMNEKALRKHLSFFEGRRAAGPMLIGVSTDPYWVRKAKSLAEQRTTNLNFYYAEPEAEAALRKGEILLDQTKQNQKVAADFKRPHDAWKGLKKGVQPLPQPLEGHEKAWAKIATRLGIDGSRGVIQLAPVIGGRRRYHHRPLTSWLLPDKKTTLTLTSDKLEGQSWNRLKNKRHVAMPRIFDVFELRLSGVREPLWAIVHERLTWPVDPDWELFVDTFFRWRAMQKDALKPAQPDDLEDFLRFIIDPKQSDPVTTQRRRVETALPFKMMNDRRADIAARRKAVWKDPGLQQKIAWAKSTLKFLRENKIKHRDLDPSNLAKTLKGRTVVTNVAESRSKGHKIGRLGRVSSAVDPVEHDPFGPTPAPSALTTAQAVNNLLDPEAPLMEELQILSTETRLLVNQIHNDSDMRAAVQEAVFQPGFDQESVLKGLEKLTDMAEKSGGKAVYIVEQCLKRLGKGRDLAPPLPMMGGANDWVTITPTSVQAAGWRKVKTPEQRSQAAQKAAQTRKARQVPVEVKVNNVPIAGAYYPAYEGKTDEGHIYFTSRNVLKKLGKLPMVKVGEYTDDYAGDAERNFGRGEKATLAELLARRPRYVNLSLDRPGARYDGRVGWFLHVSIHQNESWDSGEPVVVQVRKVEAPQFKFMEHLQPAPHASGKYARIPAGAFEISVQKPDRPDNGEPPSFYEVAVFHNDKWVLPQALDPFVPQSIMSHFERPTGSNETSIANLDPADVEALVDYVTKHSTDIEDNMAMTVPNALASSTNYYKKKRHVRRVGKMQKIIDSLVEDPSAEADAANAEVVQALRAAADHFDPKE